MLKDCFWRIPLLCITASCFVFTSSGQNTQPPHDPLEEQTFPLQIIIESSLDSGEASIGMSPQEQATGMAPIAWEFFRGKINGEDHWNFGCRKENTMRESLPCTNLPVGEYRGRWVHDYSLLQIVGGSPEDPITRFLMVSDNPKSRPADDNPLLHDAVFDFPVRFPNDKSPKDYPVLVHVYGGYSLELPVGNLPAHRRCTAQTWTTYQSTVNCTDYPSIEIHRGYVGLDISVGYVEFASLRCEAKWRWSHCSMIDPGLYYARVDKNRLMLLTHEQDGKPREIGFDVDLSKGKNQSPVK